MLKYTHISILLLLLVCSAAFAGEGGGGYAGAFLQIPIGARPAAMGGAYISIANDGSGPLFNPAGIANLKKALFSSSYRVMRLDRVLGYASLHFPTQGNSALGVTWLYAGSGSVTARDSDGDALGYDLSMNNHDFSVVFAKRFEKYLACGFKASYLHSTFAEMSAYSVSFDLGVILYINHFFDRQKRDLMPVQDIQAGLVLRNLAASYRWNSENYHTEYTGAVIGTDQDDEVPTEIGLGGSARFLDRKLVVAADVVKNDKQDAALHGGAEYFVSPEFALRGGVSDGRLTAGTGYIFKLGGRTLAIDYAFSTDKADEGSEHIFSFDLIF